MHEAIISKFEKESVWRCKYRDVERLIQEHFGFSEPFCIVSTEETGNDCSLDFNLDGKLDQWEVQEIADMLRTKDCGTFKTRTILNYLVSEKVLEPGRYIIRISW